MIIWRVMKFTARMGERVLVAMAEGILWFMVIARLGR
jgi:hypothetical protein